MIRCFFAVGDFHPLLLTGFIPAHWFTLRHDMQQLSAQGVHDAHAIINRMVGYVPDPHKIWVGTSDDQLMMLSDEFPGFYSYALTMEEASEAERNKASRPYDNMQEFT